MPISKDGNNEHNIRNNYKSKESQIDTISLIVYQTDLLYSVHIHCEIRGIKNIFHWNAEDKRKKMRIKVNA